MIKNCACKSCKLQTVALQFTRELILLAFMELTSLHTSNTLTRQTLNLCFCFNLFPKGTSRANDAMVSSWRLTNNIDHQSLHWRASVFGVNHTKCCSSAESVPLSFYLNSVQTENTETCWCLNNSHNCTKSICTLLAVVNLPVLLCFWVTEAPTSLCVQATPTSSADSTHLCKQLLIICNHLSTFAPGSLLCLRTGLWPSWPLTLTLDPWPSSFC